MLWVHPKFGSSSLLSCPATFRIDSLIFFSMALPMKKSVMKSAMKSMKKAAKPTSMKKTVMKKKAVRSVSKIARGKRAKIAVFKGKKPWGLHQGILDPTSWRPGPHCEQSTASRQEGLCQHLCLGAMQKARKELGIKGFCAVNWKTAQGKALYVKAKAIFSAP